MPVVPRYNLPQQSLNAAPDTRDSGGRGNLIADMGNYKAQAQIGNGLMQAANQIDAFQKEQDEAEVLKADAATREQYIKYQQEAKNRRGLAAQGLVQDTEKWWADTGKTVLDSLKNDRQKQLYVQRLRGVRLSSLESMGSWQDSQVRAAKQEGAVASMESAITLAYDDPTNMSYVKDALDNINRTSTALAAENGDTPEKMQMDTLKRTSALHQGVVQQLADLNPKMAREYLNTYGTQMTPTAHGQVSKVLEVSERNLAVNNAVSEVMLNSQNEIEALSTIREKFKNDAEGLKAAVSEVKTQFKERDDMVEKQSKVAFDRAWAIAIDSGKGRRGVDAATWSMLTPHQRDTIDDEVYQRNERNRTAADRAEAKKDKVNEDALWANYYQLRKEADQNPEAFKKRDLRLDYLNIPKSSRKELVDLQMKDPAEIKDVTLLDAQINLTAGSLGIEKEKKFKFESAVRDAITVEQKRRGKPLGQDDRQKIIDSMVIDGEVKGGAFFGLVDPNRKAYEVYGTPDAANFISEKNAKGTKFTEGKVYTDANGNKARYVNGKFVEEK